MLVKASSSRRPAAQSARPRKPDRRVETIVAQYRAGKTLQKIGDELGITKERVRQLLVEAGYSTRELKARGKEERLRSARDEHRSTIEKMLGEGSSPREVARSLAVPLVIVKEIDANNPEFSERRRINQTFAHGDHTTFTDSELIECLRAASREIDGVVTAPAYGELSRGRALPDGRKWPARQTIYVRFGSWYAALQRAGLPSNPPSPKKGRLLFREAECLQALIEARSAIGHLPTVSEYAEYARKARSALPSVATIYHRLVVK
jgi:hypothetical protein